MFLIGRMHLVFGFHTPSAEHDSDILCRDLLGDLQNRPVLFRRRMFFVFLGV